jgi:hypothetical protein
MFGIGQLLGLLVMGAIFGLIVQSQAKKKKQAELGNLGLGACIVASFVGSLLGMGWLLSPITMVGFLVAINSKK